MFCIKCGRKLSDDSAFCEGYGAPAEMVHPAPADQPAISRSQPAYVPSTLLPRESRMTLFFN